MTIFIWTCGRDSGRKPDMTCCRASVTRANSWRSHQCERKASVQEKHEGELMGFCKQHAPSAVQKRRDDWDARYASKIAASNARYDHERQEEIANSRAREVLKLIADGHNDPRHLARSVLALYPE